MWSTTAIVVLAGLVLGVFAVWAVRLVSDVDELRTQVEARVGWLQILTQLDTELHGGEGVTDAVAARLESLAAEITQDAATTPELGARAESLLRNPAHDRDELEAEVAALVPAIRRETAMISVALGGHWDAIYRLTGVSLLLGLSTLSSLVYIRYVVLRRVRARVMGLESHLQRADRLAAVGTLAAGVAHEINNPLGYALTSLQLAKEHAPGGELEELIDDALEGATRVQAIVADLREVARPQPDELEAFDLAAAADAALNIVQGRLRGTVDIERSFSPSASVLAARPRIEQVCLNLILNAADAMESAPRADDEGHRLILRTRTIARRRVALEIEDTGGGLDPELQARVFEPFVTSKPVGKGTGLGLFVSRNIVESFGGRLTLEPTPRGTLARIELPIADAGRRHPHR